MELENFSMLLRIRDELTAERRERLREAAGPSFGLTPTRVITAFDRSIDLAPVARDRNERAITPAP